MAEDPEITELRKQTKDTLAVIDAEIERIERVAKSMGCDAVALQNPDGSFIMPGLAMAKAQLLFTLKLLGVFAPVEKS